MWCRLLSVRAQSFNAASSIPPEISAWSSLQYLAIGSNPFLGGTLPPNVSALTSLSYLSLSSTNLTGTLPTELSKLTGLTYVG